MNAKKYQCEKNKGAKKRAGQFDIKSFTGLPFEQFVSFLPGSIYWLDKNNVYQGCNDEYAHRAGLKSRHEIVGKTNFDLIWSELSEELNAVNNKVMRTGRSVILEEGGSVTGKGAKYLTQKTPLRDNKGKIIGVIGIELSLSKQKKREKKLSEAAKRLEVNNKKLAEDNEHYISFLRGLYQQVTGIEPKQKTLDEQLLFIREYLENIISQMPGHVYWVDKNNKYLGCNDLQALHFGLKFRHQVIGKTNAQLLQNDHAMAIDENNRLVMNSGKSVQFEEIATMSDGEHCYLTQKVPLKKNKEVIGMLGISLNISDRKKMEKELIKAKEKAEVASAAKTEFILNMEHDIRTPIAHIVSFSDLLAHNEEIVAEQQKTYLEYINNSGKKLLNLVEEILAFTNLEQGNMKLQKSHVNLQKIIDDIITLEKPALVDKKLQIIVDCSNDFPVVLTDRIRLHRVLLNLVSNAIKYTENGHIKIEARFKKVEGSESDAILKINVEDSGIGIPEDKHKVIFDRFSKLHMSNINQFKGLGLGLWIVKKFVDELGGGITVDSQVNKGSTFTLTIPVQLVGDD